MRGYNYPVGKLIHKGLRNDRSNVRNTEGLVECFNLKPGVHGLTAYIPLTNAVANEIFSWPYPMIAMTSKYRWMMTSGSIYTVGSDWLTTSLAQASSAGDIWDIADFGDYVVFCNGARLVIRSAAGTFSSNSSLTTMPLALSVCNFKGQLIAGNIKSTWYDCGSNFVAWGKIGSTDMTPDGANVAGYRPMPWKGDVRRVMRLGDSVMVYCENGVGILQPFNQTFGFVELLSIGIPCKGAVGGDENTHTFVDNENCLWQIAPDFKPKRLGYQEWLDALFSNLIVISMNSNLREFYISDGIHSYMLSPYGFCKVFQKPSSVVYDTEYTYGTFDTTFTDEDLEARVTTDIIDFGSKGMKTIESIEFGMAIDPLTSAYGAVDYDYEGSGWFDRSPWLLLNPEGQCAPLVTAPDLRVAFKAESYLEAKVDSIGVGVKFSDRRFRRGAYVAETPSRTS